MNNLSENNLTEVMGMGQLGEVRVGPDGEPYQWVQGVDGLGNPIGFWKKLKRFARKAQGFVRRTLPIVQRVASAIPLPQTQAVAAGLRTITPILQRTGVAGQDGLGALYQTDDGTMYQVQGLGKDEEDLTSVMGVGQLGEVRVGPDGEPYQWVQGVDGLGNPIGFWKKLKRFARKAQGFVRRTLPIVQRVASAIPLPQTQAVAAGLRTITPILQRTGVAGQDGLGALYQTDDGTMYQVQGLGEDKAELQGLAQREALTPTGDELEGLAAEEDELTGLDEGYVRDDQYGGVGAYESEKPGQTHMFVPRTRETEMWKPLW